MNPHEALARAAKVSALALYIDSIFGASAITDAAIVAEALRRLSADGWRDLATRAGVREPSVTTRSDVVSLYSRRARGRARMKPRILATVPGGLIASVPSDTCEGVVYRVAAIAGESVCTCPGWRAHGSCKHTAAVELLLGDSEARQQAAAQALLAKVQARVDDEDRAAQARAFCAAANAEARSR